MELKLKFHYLVVFLRYVFLRKINCEHGGYADRKQYGSFKSRLRYHEIDTLQN